MKALTIVLVATLCTMTLAAGGWTRHDPAKFADSTDVEEIIQFAMKEAGELNGYYAEQNWITEEILEIST